jgi:hypothetical protein
MSGYIDPNKIQNADDVVLLVKTMVTFTTLFIPDNTLEKCPEIKKLLRESQNE